jgi:hypothetical protein
MIEESLLKSNFIGRDGFRWWIGQIPPIDAWNRQANGGGWGNRYKVRILGYHPYNESELSNEDLPWAGVLLPSTAGSGGAEYAQNPKFRPGDVVVGFFLDGDNGQIPMIMGTFGRTDQVLTTEYSSPFIPFTGYTDRESNEDKTNSVKSPRSLSEQQVSQLNQEKEDKGQEPDERSAHQAIGQTVTFADTCDDNFIGEVTGLLDNLLNVVGETTDFLQDVQSTVRKIQNLANNLVGNLFNSLYNELIPLLQKGLNLLYEDVVTKTGQHLLGVAAQKAMVIPIKELQDAMTCIASKIVEGLANTIKDLVESTIMEVVNFGVCAAEQFVSALTNDIIDKIVSGLDPFLSAIDNILQFVSFNVADFLRSSINTIKSIGGLFDCNQNNTKCKKLIKKWTIGYGAEGSFDLDKTYENVLKNMNISSKIAGITSETSPYTKPDCAKPSSCGSPTVSFFGGDGFNAKGKAILGNFVSNIEGLSDVTANIVQTASIIGVEIEDPGEGYYNAPPLVQFSDSCNLGYGAIGRAVIDYDEKSKNYGKLIAVYMISEGENYPVGNQTIESGSDVAVDNPPTVPYGVTSTIVVLPGMDYSIGDIATDDEGNTYDLTIDNGRIISAKPINKVKTTILPTISIESQTGRGAVIKPLIGKLPTQEKVEQVIDCIT